MRNNSRFLNLFSSLGNAVELTEEQFHELEYFVCSIFGKKKLLSENEARREIFWEKLEKTRR